MTNSLNDLERSLKRVNNGAGIHALPSIKMIVRGHIDLIESGALPDCPVESAIFYSHQFTSIVRSLGRSQYYFGISH